MIEHTATIDYDLGPQAPQERPPAKVTGRDVLHAIAGVGDEVADWVRPILNPIGLTQSWTLFAPDPSTLSVEVTARVTFDDGATVERDLSPLLTGPVFEQIRADESAFRQVTVDPS